MMEEEYVDEEVEQPRFAASPETFILAAAEPGDVPEGILNSFYAYVQRDAATSVLGRDEISMIHLGVEVLQDIEIMQLTPEEIDMMPQLLQRNQQVSDLAYLRLKKSVNGTLLTNAIKSVVEHVAVQKAEEAQKGGFLDRIRGRL